MSCPSSRAHPVLENLHRFLVFTLATSLGWDIGRAVTTAVLVLVTGRAVLGALRRAARRAAFEEPVTFALHPVSEADAVPLPAVDEPVGPVQDRGADVARSSP